MTKREIFDHRRPITCADRAPIQYGEEHKFAARTDGRRWWTPEEDRTLLRMRLGGASWGEISEALNRGGNYGGRTATFGNVTGRVRFLFNHEIKWGGATASSGGRSGNDCGAEKARGGNLREEPPARDGGVPYQRGGKKGGGDAPLAEGRC